MEFFIECGAKVPDHAKFCHQCGAALVIPETNIEAAPVEVEAESNPTIPQDVSTDDNGGVEEQELTSLQNFHLKHSAFRTFGHHSPLAPKPWTPSFHKATQPTPFPS